jgi:hypothetical protein
MTDTVTDASDELYSTTINADVDDIPSNNVDPDHVLRVLRRLPCEDVNVDNPPAYHPSAVEEIRPILDDEIGDVEAVIGDHEYHEPQYDPREVRQDAASLADDYRTLVGLAVLCVLNKMSVY